VTEFAETDYVQNGVFVELLSIVERDSEGSEGRFGIVTIDVKNR
jgi:hypothetical protein